MAGTRYYPTNLLRQANVKLIPSSELASMPRSALLRSFITDRWRTGTVWTFQSGVNNRIEFNRGGVKNALIASGSYTTGAAAAAAVQAALTAADGATTWTVTYNNVSHRFTITGSAPFTLLFGTGTSSLALGDSAHIDLGFASVDRASANTHISINSVHQSRHWLNVELTTLPGGPITITTGVNDAIDFNVLGSGGVGVAFVPPGTYNTPDELAESMRVALESANSAPTWHASFDEGTFLFTMGGGLPFPVSLLFGSGANVARSIASTIGFPAVDQIGADSYTGTTAVTGAPLSFDGLFLFGHNLSSTGVAEVHVDTAPLQTVGLAPTAADASFTLAGANLRVAIIASQAKRYLRLVVYDTANPDGFFEGGVFQASAAMTLSVGEGFEWVKRFEHGSEVVYAAGGANQQLRRFRRAVWQLVYRSPDPADVPKLEELDDLVRLGGNFFVCFDPASPVGETHYVFLRQGVEDQMGPENAIHILPLELVEVVDGEVAA